MKRDRTIQGLCQCGNVQSFEHYHKKTGKKIYRVLCNTCHRKGKRTKKSYCENCGFVALHPCQLDIDHIDGNKTNNQDSNLQTLCANCHRIKTYVNKEWEPKYEQAM